MTETKRKEFCRTCVFATIWGANGECDYYNKKIDKRTPACPKWEPSLEYRRVLALEELASCVVEFQYGPRFKIQPPTSYDQ